MEMLWYSSNNETKSEQPSYMGTKHDQKAPAQTESLYICKNLKTKRVFPELAQGKSNKNASASRMMTDMEAHERILCGAFGKRIRSVEHESQKGDT